MVAVNVQAAVLDLRPREEGLKEKMGNAVIRCMVCIRV